MSLNTDCCLLLRQSFLGGELAQTPGSRFCSFGSKSEKVTFTQIDFVADPEQLETNPDMGWKEDIQELQKVLGKKLPPPHLGGLPGD